MARRYYRHRTYRRRSRSAVSGGTAASGRATAYAQAYKFVAERFYQFDSTKLNSFLIYYGRKYGVSAASYARRVYPDWSSGAIKPTRKTEERMLICVPRFLSQEDQFLILSIYIPILISEQTSAQAKYIKSDGIKQTFIDFIGRIRKAEFNLDWFIAETFSLEEINEFKELVRFTLLDSAARAYEFMRDDLAKLSEALKHSPAKTSTRYEIEALGMRIDLIDKIDAPPLKNDHSLSKPPELVSRLKPLYEKYLLNVALDAIVQTKRGESMQWISLADLSASLANLRTYHTQNEYDGTINAQGRCGVAYVSFRWKNMSILQRKKTEYTILAVILTLISPALLLLGIFGVIIGFVVLAWAWNAVGDLKREIETYERN